MLEKDVLRIIILVTVNINTLDWMRVSKALEKGRFYYIKNGFIAINSPNIEKIL